MKLCSVQINSLSPRSTWYINYFKCSSYSSHLVDYNSQWQHKWLWSWSSMDSTMETNIMWNIIRVIKYWATDWWNLFKSYLWHVSRCKRLSEWPHRSKTIIETFCLGRWRKERKNNIMKRWGGWNSLMKKMMIMRKCENQKDGWEKSRRTYGANPTGVKS